jgi:hypothetical protein
MCERMVKMKTRFSVEVVPINIKKDIDVKFYYDFGELVNVCETDEENLPYIIDLVNKEVEHINYLRK